MINFVTYPVLVAILIMGYESLGWALPTISVIFLLYGLFGHLIPGALSHQAFTFKRLISFLYLGTEGVFGSAMSVSATFIFIFILFGAFLEKSGAGQFFVNLALTATGRVTGGPALAAVASSALMGTISGSGVSNVVTTGTFTIPLMKANGYDKNFAGAVEAVASNGGQILPPVMGSVAFLMAEMIGVSYFTVAKAAAVPALLYFFAVGIAVYFEAKRLNLRPDPNAQYERVGVVFKSGFYYLLPIALLIVFIICGYSVLRAGAYAAILTIALSYVKKDTAFHLKDFGAVVTDVAKQVRPIVAACACAGIIMGITSLTNLGIKLSGLIVTVSQGNLMIALVMTMLVSLVMGMGLPTTAAYLLLAVLGAPALIKLGADPLPAHLFILYFGCMSTITPPVALSTYAAAGISGGSPMKTGIYAMKLASVAFLIPYIFVYGQELLLYGSLGSILLAILSASLGCVALAGGMIGWLGAKMPMPLRFVLVGAAITLMIPGALTDVIGVVLMAAPAPLCRWLNEHAVGIVDVVSARLVRVFFKSSPYMVVACVIALFRQAQAPKLRWRYVLAVSLLLCALLLSFTRSLYGALGLTAVLSITAVLILCPAGRKRVLAFLLAVVVCFGVLVTVQEFALEGSYLSFAVSRTIGKEVPTSWASQLRSQLRGEDPGDSPDDGEMDSQRSYIEVTEKSDQLRQETKDSLNVYIQRSPIIGCGLGASAANRDKGVDEYFYLDMLARTGIVGLVLYILPFGYVVLWCLRRRSLLRECPEGAAVVCGLCTFWVVTWFNPWMNAVLGIAWYAVTLSVPQALEEQNA